MFPKALLALLLSSIYSQLLHFPEPPSLCRRHLTLLFLSPNQLRLKHYLLQNTLQQTSSWMTANLSTLNSSKLNSCSSDSKSNYTKYITPRCTQPIPLASLTSSLMNTSPLQTKMSSLSKSRYYNIHQLRCIRPYLDSTTASTMHCHLQSFIVHSELDYCNSVYYNLPKSETTRLKQIQNSLSRAVVKAPNICLPLYSCTALKENMCNFPVAVYEIITLVDHMLLVSIYDTKSNKPNALEWEARAQQLLRWATVWPQ